MAERRMFTKKVTDDDNFMALSASAQALYLHLSMSADDDGFCNQVSLSMFKAHASVQDLQALLERRYIYQFDNGVIVIKHWRMANALRKDRYTPTAFQEELSKLDIKKNGAYTWLPDGCQAVADCLPQDSIGKNSVVYKEKYTKESYLSVDFDKAWNKTFDRYPKKRREATAKQNWMRRLVALPEDERQQLATDIYQCITLYLEDYKENKPDDSKFEFVPKFDEWLEQDCDYWLRQLENARASND